MCLNGSCRLVGKGYRIQFAFPPPALQRRDSHTGGPRAGSGYGTRSESPIKEGGHRGGPPHERESGFYSRYFIVPKKDGGLRPIIDLRQLKQLSQSAEVQDAHAEASRVTESGPRTGLSR